MIRYSWPLCLFCVFGFGPVAAQEANPQGVQVRILPNGKIDTIKTFEIGEQIRISMLPGNRSAFHSEMTGALYDRIKPISDNQIENIWGSTKKLKPYKLQDSDIDVFAQALVHLPDAYVDLLKSHVATIYFVEGFRRSGWLRETSGVFTWPMYDLILSPKLLTQSVSDFLNAKEMTVFSRADSVYQMNIEATQEFRALWFVLLHEATHILDGTQSTHDFAKDVWVTDAIPKSVFDFPLRDQVHFYRGQQIPEKHMLQMYESLSKTPFASLYGSLDEQEDFAEFGAFYYMTQIKNLPYRIVITKQGDEVFAYEPFSKSDVLDRYQKIKGILQFE